MDKCDYSKKSSQNFFEYETIFKSSPWSFGHSDPYSSSVGWHLEEGRDVSTGGTSTITFASKLSDTFNPISTMHTDLNDEKVSKKSLY